MFLRQCWYVFGWVHELKTRAGPLGRVIIGEPIVVWQDADGELHAMEDRCPHRLAPLSLGRVEGDQIRCLYHGMKFDKTGRCMSVPLLESPPKVQVRVYPVVVKDDWIWVWTGAPEGADEALIPDAFGVEDPVQPMQTNSIEYEANYQLIHDNLCDLSHLDFVHASTLQPATGASWSDTAPRVRTQGDAIRFERWFENAQLPSDPNQRVDVWSTYDFAVPGIFIMRGARYPAGTAAAFQGRAPSGVEPLVQNVEQQAVTPISAHRSAYHYATGLLQSSGETYTQVSERMNIVTAAFEEDRRMIEAQQKIWDLSPPGAPKHFLPQDKGPFLMRQMIKRLIDEEAAMPARKGSQPAPVSPSTR